MNLQGNYITKEPEMRRTSFAIAALCIAGLAVMPPQAQTGWWQSEPRRTYEVCHVNSDGSDETLTVGLFGLFLHLLHGDTYGACEDQVQGGLT